MKKVQFLLLTLALALLCPGVLKAELRTDYTVDFSSEIKTSAHDFKVASNWKHIVDIYTDDYGYDYWMSYSYKTTGGVDNSACLLANEQRAGDNWDYTYTYDLLVTPVVSGTVKLQVKANNSKAYVEIYTLNETATARGTRLDRFGSQTSKTLTESGYTEISVQVDEPQRIGIRASQVYLDDFYAEQAETEPEKAMVIVSAEPSQTNGSIYWDQQADGSVLVKFTNVTVKNTGEADLKQGEKNFSVSIINGKTKAALGPATDVPQDLNMGDTSAPFEVSVSIPADQVKSLWSYAYASAQIYLMENLQGSIVQRALSYHNAYESKFTFKEPTSTSSSNISKVDFGMVTESVTKTYAIINDGAAPLSVVSTAVSDCYQTNLPEGAFTVPAHGKQEIEITLPAEPIGAHNGTLTIVYTDNSGKDVTFNVELVGYMLGETTWFTTFKGEENKSDVVYPEGSVAESGIQPGYNTVGGIYDPYLKSYTNSDYASANNKFITPLLHAEAGDVMTFDVSRQANGNQYNLKVYVSTDRVNWGEPLLTVGYGDLSNYSYVNKSITFPEAGDYYVGFAVYGMQLDNIVGLSRVDVAHDLFMGAVDQKDQIQSGDKFEATVAVYSPLAAAAADYTAKFYLNGEVAATIASVDLAASAKNSKNFKTGTLNPTVETTATYPTYFEFAFTDGTVFTTPVKDLTITNDPVFTFFVAGTTVSDSRQPDCAKGTIDFGIVNTIGTTRSYELYNWGTAPLTVKSITAAEGFSTSISEAVVPAKERQAVDVVFSAETPDTYSGELTIVYVDASGEDVTYTIGLQGTLLDPNKWYGSFENPEKPGTAAWPAGSLHQSSVNLEYESQNGAMYSNAGNAMNTTFITPLLKAEAGESFTFDARLYRSNWPEGVIEVYAAKSRADLENEEARISLGKWSGRDVDEDHTLTPEFSTCTATIEEAGEYYLGFVLYNRTRVDNIYGLALVPVEHDVVVAAAEVPEKAVQNVASTAKITLCNAGLETEAAGYTVSVYVDGVKAGEAEGVEIPTTNSLSENKVVTEVSFRYPKTGSLPVYLTIDFGGDYVLTTEPVTVEFAEETLSGETVVGTPSGYAAVPVDLNYKNSEAVSLYTPEELGLTGGEKITSIVLKGYYAKSPNTTLKVAYAWTDEATLAAPSGNGAYDTADMTIYYDGYYDWTQGGSAAEPIDMISINFPEPVIYEAGKSLKLLISATTSAYYFGLNIEKSNGGQTYYHQNDGTQGVFTGSWSTQSSPVLHMSIAAEPRAFVPTVLDEEGNAVAGATVTLISTDGDNVQYSGTTDESGSCTVNVIQSSRTYNVEVRSEAGEADLEDVCVADESIQATITLMPVVVVSDDSEHAGGKTSAVVYLNTVYEPGFNAIALPFELTAEEAEGLFGEGSKVLEFYAETRVGTTVKAHFKPLTGDMEAGKPYLVQVTETTAPTKFTGKAIVDELSTVIIAELCFTGAEKETPLTEGMYLLSDDNYQAPTPKPAVLSDETEAPTVKPFHAYLRAITGNIAAVVFDDADDIETGIDSIDADTLDKDDEIFTISGIRVKNPAKGQFYIVNGKKALLK